MLFCQSSIKIPVVADIHADPEFGTGVVKITPAHDPNDYQVGLRHNLPRVVVMNPDATMNENAGKYQGMDRFACREALVKDLQEAGLLIKIKKDYAQCWSFRENRSYGRTIFIKTMVR